MYGIARSSLLKAGLLGAALALSAIVATRSAAAQPIAHHGTAPTAADEWAAITTQIQQHGKANVIVSLNAPAFDSLARTQASKLTPNVNPKSTAKADGEARLALANQARTGLLSALSTYNVREYAGSDWFIPAMALTVDQTALTYLHNSPLVSAISPDHELKAFDNSSAYMIGAPTMWNFSAGHYNGYGQTVAILDTGVQESHPFLTSDGSSERVVQALEACYSGAGGATITGYTLSSFCGGGAYSATGAGAGTNCPLAYSGCEHGTHVAGIAAGGYVGGNGEYGIAYAANIMPVQVFTLLYDGSNYTVSAFDSDIISGLSRVDYEWNHSAFYIAAVNMSLGNTSDNTSSCDTTDSAMTTAINTLRNNDTVATVIAAGNSYYTDGIAYPACISSAISVGATDFQDNVPNFSNSGPNTTIFAPGVSVYSSIPTSTYAYLSGTSMATPQVVGSIALLRQETGVGSSLYSYSMSVSQIVAILSNTGRVIYNANNGLYQIRINVDQAGIVALARQDTIGIYRGNTFYLRNTNSYGVADQTYAFGYGSDAYPIVGDWPGDAGFDELGVYNRNTGVFTLCSNSLFDNNSSCAGTPSSQVIHLTLGNPNDYPIAGRWVPRPSAYATRTVDSNSVIEVSQNAQTGVGVFRPTNGILYLKNYLSTGFADYSMVLGSPGDDGIAGDWNMDGQSSPGVYRPTNAVWYLTNKVTNGAVYSDSNFTYGNSGASGDLPVVGNWNTYDNVFGVGPGVYRTSTGYYFLRNTLDTGYSDNAFFYGNSSDLPIVGDWKYVNAIPKPNLVTSAPPTILVTPPARTQSAPSGSVPGGNQIGG